MIWECELSGDLERSGEERGGGMEERVQAGNRVENGLSDWERKWRKE